MGVRLSRPDLESRLAMHRAFWNREPQRHPIAAFRVVPDFFFSRHDRGAEKLLEPGKRSTPDMLAVEDFLPDYEEMFRISEELGQDAFWTAEPFTGIPWMEAILDRWAIRGVPGNAPGVGEFVLPEKLTNTRRSISPGFVRMVGGQARLAEMV